MAHDHAVMSCARCGRPAPCPDVDLLEDDDGTVVIVYVPNGWFPVIGCVDVSPIVCALCADDVEINRWLASRPFRDDLSPAEAIALLDD
jgi:hypothetical protein